MQELGAVVDGSGCRFTVWAPEKAEMILHIVAPREQKIEMRKDEQGYFTVYVELVENDSKYYFMPDGKADHADPASGQQPEGVHGPSAVVDHNYGWTDNSWRGIPLQDYIIYEVHIGTFTDEGTFDAAIERLDDLVDTGINAIEIMPISQFSGKRNWGYDGVFPYAAQNSYGGYIGLKRLVNACHAKGIAVILDVVYNHMGPEGNCLQEFAPYFTEKYKTPWGQAINFDGAWSDGVRNYFCNNALFWLQHFHIDALRLDAVHEMYDFGATHFWELLHTKVNELSQTNGRNYFLIAESDLNNPKIVKHPEAGGYGFNAQWLDDFHHSLYVLLDKNGKDHYADFGAIEQLAKAYTDGFVFSGEYVNFRKKTYGSSSAGIAGDRFIIFNQNHDQIGNRVDGARLSTLVTFPQLMLASAAVLLAPYIPMLFMGEEYGEDTPFNYFIDHEDDKLVEAVRKGRKNEFSHDGTPADPKCEQTFLDSKLRWSKRNGGKYNLLLRWNKALLAFRKTHKALSGYNKNDVKVNIWSNSNFALHRKSEDGLAELLAVFNMSDTNEIFTPPPFAENWTKVLDSGTFSSDNGSQDSEVNIICGQQLSIPAHTVVVYTNMQ